MVYLWHIELLKIFHHEPYVHVYLCYIAPGRANILVISSCISSFPLILAIEPRLCRETGVTREPEDQLPYGGHDGT